MSFIDELKRLARPYEDEEEDEFEDEFENTMRSAPAPRASESDRRSNKVVNIHTTTQLQVRCV